MFYDTKVRALCAQLTLETNPTKCEELAGELAVILAGKWPAARKKEETPFTRVFSLNEKKVG